MLPVHITIMVGVYAVERVERVEFRRRQRTRVHTFEIRSPGVWPTWTQEK